MPVIFIKNVSEAGVEPAISRLEVGRDIHFATRTSEDKNSPYDGEGWEPNRFPERSDRDSNSGYRSQNPV
jgi:hypothetical protein